MTQSARERARKASEERWATATCQGCGVSLAEPPRPGYPKRWCSSCKPAKHGRAERSAVAAAPPATPAASASQPPGLVTKVRSLIDDLQREGPWDSKQEALASLALTLATTIEDGETEAKSIPSLSKELRGVIADLTAQRGAGDDPDGWLDAPPVRDAAQSGAGHPRA